ncbi:zinc-binding dehydrogenase [Maribacter algarum]|uniref:Zinc-binding dehydrogenase n=1 Tax=Maribacter algarum (ex Zhang et al. 2020) TaxID=2578118 RepID=A0A5S3PUF1_9FLAO|nr:zinc-binding dehydrogenase [Maribacter algarum]TMM58636.1 zinc-binding dehydrogenase [Maribacter algarum]
MRNKQLVISKFSDDIKDASEIITSPIRMLGDNEILVQNKYIGINALYDRELYRGRVPYIDVQFPYIFGVEAVGVVVETGKNVEKVNVGDALSTVKVGTAYQEYQIISDNDAIKIPEATAEYLTINPTGVSGYLALKNTAELKEGETIVVSAASGGLGHIVVQLAKRKNCHVVGICGKPEKVELLKKLNVCDRIINYREEDIADVLNNEYANKINVGFDSVGSYMFDAFLANIAPLGRLVVSGLATELTAAQFEQITGPRVYESIYWKGASVRCFMNHLFREQQQEGREFLFDLYQKGALQVKVDATSFEGIESIVNASEYLLAGQSCGKVVVKI